MSSLTNSIGHVEKVFESTNRGDIYNQALPKSAVNSNWSLQKWICFALFDIDGVVGVVEIHLSVLHHQPACQDRAVVVTPQPNSGKKKRNVLCKKIKIIAVFFVLYSCCCCCFIIFWPVNCVPSLCWVCLPEFFPGWGEDCVHLSGQNPVTSCN